MEIADPTYDPMMMGHADLLTQTWAMKGYPVIYLTNRPHPLRVETRTWLAEKMMPTGPVITSNGTASDAAAYKTVWLQRMTQTFGWQIVAAYGNASTDITAYANAGIPKSETFIVGPLAGSDSTQPIDNMDFAQHIQSYVDTQPNQ
jgi:phosphatidate phosphatase PAH1